MKWVEIPYSKVPKLKQLCNKKFFPILKDLLMIPTRGGSYAFAVDEEGNIWFIEQTYPDETRYLKMEASE